MIDQALIEDAPERHTFRVHRSAMTSPELFQQEIGTIFSRCWLYIGHDSELPEPGSFLRRDVGTKPMFLVRGRDGVVRAFFNTCPHRGATICRQDRGVARSFQCFYHAWTFSTEGTFLGGPDLDGFGPEWDRATADLAKPPHLDQYRGFFFVNFDPAAEPLHDYLGPAREYIDLIIDQSESGIRVVGGSQRYTMGANWKLLVENTVDGYHAAPLHTTYFKYVQSVARRAGGRPSAGKQEPFGVCRSLGRGHATLDIWRPYGRPVARWSPLFGEDQRDAIEQRRRRLVELHGRTKAFRIAEMTSNLLVYPNLVINDGVAVTIRKIDPVAVDQLSSTAWAVAPADESPELLARRLDSFLTFYGPGGFATPDDVEALESCQRGFDCGMPEWSDISRGIHRPSTSLDEAGQRGFWRMWEAQLTGRTAAEVREESTAVDWDAMVELHERSASAA
jgi:p-cumate 2,3-dioxygenase alpha subunit